MTRTPADSVRQTLVYILLAMFMLVAIMPFVGIFLTAFKDTPELVRGPFALPETWRVENFVNAWNGARFGDFFLNTLAVVVPVVIIASALSLMSGYAFGTMSFPGDNILLLLVILGLMMPLEAVIIPLWQIMTALGLRETYWAVILPQVALSFSFGTFWMRSHFKNFPTDLIEAAVVDGCTPWGVLWRILFPLSRPALLSMVVLVFMWTWNEFFLVLVLMSSSNWTLPVGLALLQGRYSSHIPTLAAASLIVSGPVLILYAIFQRHFIRGMISGAIKA